MSDSIEIPDRLYKYERVNQRSLLNLQEGKIYFGSALDFNDPYDCALTPRILEPSDQRVEIAREFYLANGMNAQAEKEGIEISVPDLRSHLMAIAGDSFCGLIEDFARSNGVTCFSESKENLLMWSHYGGGGAGMCLEFNTALRPFEQVYHVDYSEEMPSIDPVALAIGEYGADKAREFFLTKSIDWKYEKEWRAFHQVSGQRYTFDPNALTNIYLGPKIEEEHRRAIVRHVGTHFPLAGIWLGVRSRTEFRIEFRREGMT